MIKYKTVVLALLLLSSLLLPTACSSRDKTPEGPTATVIDDETGKPIEGAVAIAIWRDYKGVSVVNALHGGGPKFKKAEEVVSDKEGNIFIPDFWKTTKGKGGTGSVYDPRLTIYKFGYVCWDQQEIFHPNNRWGERKDFNRDNRIVRLKKWPEDMSFDKHSGFINNVTSGNISDAPNQLFNKATDAEDPWIIKELEKKYLKKY
jgi:hypothetical protein